MGNRKRKRKGIARPESEFTTPYSPEECVTRLQERVRWGAVGANKPEIRLSSDAEERRDFRVAQKGDLSGPGVNGYFYRWEASSTLVVVEKIQVTRVYYYAAGVCFAVALPMLILGMLGRQPAMILGMVVAGVCGFLSLRLPDMERRNLVRAIERALDGTQVEEVELVESVNNEQAETQTETPSSASRSGNAN